MSLARPRPDRREFDGLRRGLLEFRYLLCSEDHPVAAIILCPESYMTWLFDNSTLLLYDVIFMDRRDYEAQQTLANRSTLDHKVARFLKMLHKELGLLRLFSYGDVLSTGDRSQLHTIAQSFCAEPVNDPDVALVGRQAWGHYIDYMTEKVVLFDDSSEPGVKETLRKKRDTANWYSRLFQPDGKRRDLTDEEAAALRHGVTRTLAKALASVKVYQHLSWQYPQQQFFLHERREYDHAFTLAGRLALAHYHSAPVRILDTKLAALSAAGDLIYECYHEYCAQFDGPVITKPDLLVQLRRDFESYRRITNDLAALHNQYLQDEALTRAHVIKQMERIFGDLRRQLLDLCARLKVEWDVAAAISVKSFPVGRLIRILLEQKATEAAVQETLSDYFSQCLNAKWKPLFVMLRSASRFKPLGLANDLKTLSFDYVSVRPDWWVNYLPWYEGGSDTVLKLK